MCGEKLVENLSTDDHTDWDIEGMVEQIYYELDGVVSTETVEQTLTTLFANYENARVKSFVPVIVRRQAKNMLRAQANNGG